MEPSVLVYVEQEDGVPKRTALEAGTKASELVSNGELAVTGLVLGAGAAQSADVLRRYGFDEILVCEDNAFGDFLVDPHVEIVAQVIGNRQPAAVLFPDTGHSRDIAARVAARVGASLVSGVVDLTWRDGTFEAQETIFGGNYVTTVECRNATTGVFLIRPNAFEARETVRDGAVSLLNYVGSERTQRVRIEKVVEEQGAPIPLEEAAVIVSGGRGLGGPEPFELLQELADALGGAVGASRAAVDAGWISYSHQVGQTGRTVKPSLYIAVGISGAVQHRVGMQTAETVIAINKDSGVPIFALSDLAVVGDLFQIVPALTAEIKRRKGA